MDAQINQILEEIKDKDNFGSMLYDKLPLIYKTEDGTVKPYTYPLKRFYQIASVGLDFLKAKTDGRRNLYDLDKVPAEFLPHLAKMMGFTFPYDMPESDQRNLLKSLPYLYKMKGTGEVFNYLGRKVYGISSSATTALRIEDLVRYLDVNVEINGEVAELDKKTEWYRRFAEKFRPVNHHLNVIINLYYADVFSRLINSDVLGTDTLEVDDATDTFTINGSEYSFETLQEYIEEVYTFSERTTDALEEILMDSGLDVLNRTNFADDEVIVVNIDESLVDLINDPKLNSFILNSSILMANDERYNKSSLSDIILESFAVTDLDDYLAQKLDELADTVSTPTYSEFYTSVILESDESSFAIDEGIDAKSIPSNAIDTIVDTPTETITDTFTRFRERHDGYSTLVGQEFKLSSNFLLAGYSNYKREIFTLTDTDTYAKAKTDDVVDNIVYV